MGEKISDFVKKDVKKPLRWEQKYRDTVFALGFYKTQNKKTIF